VWSRRFFYAGRVSRLVSVQRFSELGYPSFNSLRLGLEAQRGLSNQVLANKQAGERNRYDFWLAMTHGTITIGPEGLNMPGCAADLGKCQVC
jgi:hypothetical protein